MSYKWSTGSVFRGDIYFEDDVTGELTFIDFEQDKISLKPSGSAVLEVGWNAEKAQVKITGATASQPPTAANAQFTILYDAGDYCWFGVDTNGSLTIETVDSDGALGDIFLNPDGNVIINQKNAVGISDNTGCGEVVYFGTEDDTDTLAAGKLMYLDPDGDWKYADGNIEAESGPAMLAIALGTAVSDGLLIRGFFDCGTIEGTFVKGAPVYISELAGVVDFTAPSGVGDVVRIIGHGTDTANVIYFNPSPDWITL
jgi:hypothetical protein